MTHKSEYLVQAKPKSGDWVTLVVARNEEQALEVRDRYRDPDYLREYTHGWDWTGEVRAILRETEVVTHVSEIVLEREIPREVWVQLRANYLELNGPDEFPRGYYEHVAEQEWEEDHSAGGPHDLLSTGKPEVCTIAHPLDCHLPDGDPA